MTNFIKQSLTRFIISVVLVSQFGCIEQAKMLGNPAAGINNSTSNATEIDSSGIEDEIESQGTVTGNPKSPEIETGSPVFLPPTIAKAETPNALKTKGSFLKSSDAKTPSKIKITGVAESAAAQSTIYYFNSSSKEMIGSTIVADDGSFEIDVAEDFLNEKIDISYEDNLSDAPYISVEVLGENSWLTSITQTNAIFDSDVVISNGSVVSQADNGANGISMLVTPIIGGETNLFTTHSERLSDINLATNSSELLSYETMPEALIGITADNEIVRVLPNGQADIISDDPNRFSKNVVEFSHRSFAYPDSDLFVISHGVSTYFGGELFIFTPTFNPTQFAVDDAAYQIDMGMPQFIRHRDIAWHNSQVIISVNKQIANTYSALYDPSIPEKYDVSIVEFDNSFSTDIATTYYDTEIPAFKITQEDFIFESETEIRSPVAGYDDGSSDLFFLYVCKNSSYDANIENICHSSVSGRTPTNTSVTDFKTGAESTYNEDQISNITISKNNQFAAFVRTTSESSSTIYLIYLPTLEVFQLFDSTTPTFQLKPKFSDDGEYDLFFLSGNSSTALQGNVLDLRLHPQASAFISN